MQQQQPPPPLSKAIRAHLTRLAPRAGSAKVFELLAHFDRTMQYTEQHPMRSAAIALKMFEAEVGQLPPDQANIARAWAFLGATIGVAIVMAELKQQERVN